METCCGNTCETVEVLEDVTEIDERGLRRLADSRGCLLAKEGSVYRILGRDLYWLELSDDEAWAVLSDMPQIYTLSGRGVLVDR